MHNEEKRSVHRLRHFMVESICGTVKVKITTAMGVDKQLAIPDLAAKDPRSFELLRVWIAQGSQAITLQPGIWQDPAAWGVMLADLARNIVTVHVEAVPDLDTEGFLAAMLEGFDTEIESVLNEFADSGEGEDVQDQEAG